MVLSEIKRSVMKKLDEEAREHNISTTKIRSKINRAIEILVEADSKSNAGTDNGLQEVDEYNFNITEIEGELCFIIEIGNTYSPINLRSNGERFMKELFSLPDNVNIRAEERGRSQGYDSDGLCAVIISLVFKF